MKKFLLIIILIVFCSSYSSARKMISKDHTVMLDATTDGTNITLSWNLSDIHQEIKIFRKLASDAKFPNNVLAELPIDATSWTDNSVTKGIKYTYKVQDSLFSDNKPLFAFGYVDAGIEVEEVSNYGRVILLVDSTIYADLEAELLRLVADMENEGWGVVTRIVPRAEEFDKDKVKEVKQIILEEWANDKINTNTVFLFGRVPVPYSGISNTDGHGNHKGAWPADMYYGDVDEVIWTDSKVNNVTASRPQNHNIPGDGKFDIDVLKSQYTNYEIELRVGRVDLYNMPQFAKEEWANSELELLRNYLNKDHSFRTGEWADIPKEGVVWDGFSSMAEGFASSGYRNFASLCGKDKVTTLGKNEIIPILNEKEYLFAYGCGGGSYKSCSGVGTTKLISENKMHSVFTMFFGSYFGDWDVKDNILRAPLCTEPYALTSCWDGRPHWYFHEMNMGEPIGKSVITSQNNRLVFLTNITPYNGGWVEYNIQATGRQMCFLGDPTLRLDSYSGKMASELNIVQYSKTKTLLSWLSPPIQEEYHYNVYRRYSNTESWEKINVGPLTKKEIYDEPKQEGEVFYQVRVAELMEVNGGTYYSSGPALQGSINFSTSVNDLISEINIYPNPATVNCNIDLKMINSAYTQITIYSQTGELIKEIYQGNIYKGSQFFSWDLSDNEGNKVANGVYILKINSGDTPIIKKIIVL